MHARTKEFSQRFPGNSLSLSPSSFRHLSFASLWNYILERVSRRIGSGSQLDSMQDLDRSRCSPNFYLYKNLQTEAKQNERKRKPFFIIVVTNVQIRITYWKACFTFSISHTFVFFLHIYWSVYSTPILNFGFIYFFFLKFLKIDIDNVIHKFSSNYTYVPLLFLICSKKTKRRREFEHQTITKNTKDLILSLNRL